MAIRINYTGRRKICRDDARIRLRGAGNEMFFDAALQIDKYKIPEPNAKVWVEAYHRTTLMRFDFGRAGLVTPPSDRRLALFPDPGVVLFRVKVTSEGVEAGKLLAEADGIKPRRPDETDDQRTPLLPVRQGIIGEELWRVDYTGEGESPELIINNNVEDWKALARDPRFYPIVAPSALRMIMIQLALVDRAAHIEDDEHWQSKWWRFVTTLPGSDSAFIIESTTNADDIVDWINDTVNAFAKQSNSLQTFLRATGIEPTGKGVER